MKITDCLLNEDGIYTLTLVTNKKNIMAQLASPLDIQTTVLTIPPIQLEHIQGTIQIMLRSLYPANPNDILIDFILPISARNEFTRHGGRIAAFAVMRNTLEKYRALSSNLIPPITLLSPIASNLGKIDSIGFLSTATWTQIVQFNRKQTVAAIAFKGDPNSLDETLICEIFNLATLENITVFNVYLDDSLTVKQEKFPSCLAFFGFAITKIPDKFNINDFHSNFIYPPTSKKKTSNKSFIIAILLFLNVFFFITVTEYKLRKERTLCDMLKREYITYERNLAELSTMNKEIANYSARNSKNTKTSYIDPYAIIAKLTQGMGNLYIRSLTIRSNTFQFTAEHADSLRVLSALSASSFFKNITLIQSTPLDKKLDLFTISGEISNDYK